jgi:ABC-type sulfate/molybdate transport systems ATPase subunit
MSEIQLTAVSTPFLRSVDLTVRHGESFVIVGPSGAGKTTLLRVIAGLVPHTGQVWLGGRSMEGVPPYLRRVGYVSQDLHLFPHLTFEGNLVLAMERLPLTKGEKRAKARELAGLVGIGGLLGRRPSTLSGGEKQRAAIARALASAPCVLLLDEPFSKVDFRTALRLRNEIRRLHRQLELTTILVTHDMAEARELGDRLAVMQLGSLQLHGASGSSPESRDRGGPWFLERENVLACSGKRRLGNGLVEVVCAGLTLFVPDEGRDFSHITVPSSKICFDRIPPGGSPINRFRGTITAVASTDATVQVVIEVNRESLVAELASDRWHEMGLAKGDLIHGLIRLQDMDICRCEDAEINGQTALRRDLA